MRYEEQERIEEAVGNYLEDSARSDEEGWYYSDDDD